MSPSRSVWNSWSQMLLRWVGEHGNERTILSLRSVVRTILAAKTAVGNCLLAEGAQPERVAGASGAGARVCWALRRP